ncbi:histidine-type phosphatase [Asaia bogorensis]|uniref:histidine-type phosphatase n=1 Tax=Asaia bogorensis TaxID=91915 RepID=UPI000EFAA984|nr:histidine-type phosphatase [Asaia bogorensis]
MNRALILSLALALGGAGTAQAASSPVFSSVEPEAPARLERVVLIARHGIRSPTHDSRSLEQETGVVWPSWPVAPGELTDHGRATLDAMMQGVARYYDLACTHNISPCIGATPPFIWADSADDRTRESGRIMARALSPGHEIAAHSLVAGQHDPVFDAVTAEFVKQHHDQMAQDATQSARNDRLARPDSVNVGLAALQQLFAPQACETAQGPCFKDGLVVSEKKGRPSLGGGMTLAATLAENLLLIHAQSLDQAGNASAREAWVGKINPALLTTVLPVHDYISELVRRHGVAIAARSAVMADIIARFMAGEAITLGDGSIVPPATRLLAFAGHDTTLDALAARYGLDWHFSDQPDSTAPDTTLAFEQWRDGKGQIVYRARIFHQSLQALREGKSGAAQPLAVTLTRTRLR